MTQTTSLTRVCALAEIPAQGARRVLTPMGEIAVFRTLKDEVFALKNQCPHKKGPLSEGIVHGNKVTCPLHNWVISLETGEAQGADHGCTGTIPVEVAPDGQVYLALPTKVKVSA